MASENRLYLHFVPRARRLYFSKYSASTGFALRADLPPARISSRRRTTSCSRRSNSRMYSLLLVYSPSDTCESTKDLRDSGSEIFIVLIRRKYHAWQGLP